jgi:hypothetical protein
LEDSATPDIYEVAARLYPALTSMFRLEAKRGRAPISPAAKRTAIKAKRIYILFIIIELSKRLI